MVLRIGTSLKLTRWIYTQNIFVSHIFINYGLGVDAVIDKFIGGLRHLRTITAAAEQFCVQ